MKIILNLLLQAFCLQCALLYAKSNVGSRENDPESLVENVSVIYGDYSEIETDLVVPGPDALTLSRFYSSRDSLSNATFGGWRFFPQCFLSLEDSSVWVGTPEGNVLTFTPDPKNPSLFLLNGSGLMNTARGMICSWTNQTNNSLFFDEANDCFTLTLSSGGKRHYAKNASLYLLFCEVLPNGNKIFYEYDKKGQLCLLKATNSSETKVFSWIKLQYADSIHVETSDGKTLEYRFTKDQSGHFLLTKVVRPERPPVHYSYKVLDGYALLTKKELPEGRSIYISYSDDSKHRVESISTGFAKTHFSYGNAATEVLNPLGGKTVYSFNDHLHLIAVEQYLNGELYRTKRKLFGKKNELTELSIEDENDSVLYRKTLTYDPKGNILQENIFGNLTGNDFLDEEPEQEFHMRRYTHKATSEGDIIDQMDSKGNGMRFLYKKDTNILLAKTVLERSEIKKREFYFYDEDAVLVQIIIDDGNRSDPHAIKGVTERHLTTITPKQNLPNVGIPEVIEEAYLDPKENQKKLLKQTKYHFDSAGRVIEEAIYDSNEDYRYSIKKAYDDRGLLILETDPMGNETHYSYDANFNCVAKYQTANEVSFTYEYDEQNRLIASLEKEKNGKYFGTKISYDAMGNKSSEEDRFGHVTLYTHDELSRLLSIAYPEVQDEKRLFYRPTHFYQYDLFDNVISITDPKGNTTHKVYTIYGKPAVICYQDGTKELFKYDPEGSLHRYCDKEGIVQVFEYDYLGRVARIEQYDQNDRGPGKLLSETYFRYDAFHLLSEEKLQVEEDDEDGDSITKTTYSYDKAGRLSRLKGEQQDTEFFYDSLGRLRTVKKWSSQSDFTKKITEYDLLDRVIEECTKDKHNTILLKNKYKYDGAGHLVEVIEYPQNRESILASYQYDGFGRPCKILDAFRKETVITYNDEYRNEWGQRVERRIIKDPLGNEQEEIFDAFHQLVKVTKKDKEGKLLTQAEFSYDAMGNKVQETYFPEKSKASRITKWSYGLGNQPQKIYYCGKDQDFHYDQYGRLITKCTPAKEPIHYEYDTEGKLTSLSYEKNESCKKYQFTYDHKGRVKKIELGKSGILQYEFAGDLFSEIIQDKWGSYYISKACDRQGRIESIQLPNGTTIEYRYEGPLVKKISYEIDEDLFDGDVDSPILYTYQVKARDPMGHPLEEAFGNCTKRQKFDPSGRKIEISTKSFKQKIPLGGFDLLNNVTKQETTVRLEKSTTTYEYDALSQLISETGTSTHRYCYDYFENRLQKDEMPYEVNEADELLNAEGISFTFDANGNLSSKIAAENRWTFTSNPLGQITSMQDSNTKITCTYDLAGRRLMKKVEVKDKKTRIFRFFYIGQTELGCFDEKGKIIQLKIPKDPNDPEHSQSVAIMIRSKIYVPIYDLQGNIACLVDTESNKIVESYCYSAFGEEEIFNEKGEKIPNTKVGNPWRYKGKRKESQTGLIYFGIRYYDPKIGRWISPDPSGTADGPNRYAFVHNNPINYTDSFGLATEKNQEFLDYFYGNSEKFIDSFYGEYEPHCTCETHRGCKSGGDVRDTSCLIPWFGIMPLAEQVFQVRSQVLDIGSKNFATSIGFINGINTRLEEAKSHTLLMSQYVEDTKMELFHNASHSLPLDVLECMLGQCRIPTYPVYLLLRQWKRFAETHKSEEKYLQICHSGGAIHTKNALYLASKSLRDKIIVVAIAPGEIVPRSLCYRSYNYASKRDFIPSFHICGLLGLRHNDELIILEPHPDAPFWDHRFDSQTYQAVIKDRIINYINTYHKK